MSRIGNKPITILEGVTVEISNNSVIAKGPKGELSQSFDSNFVKVESKDGEIIVSRFNEDKESKGRHGLYRSLIANAIEGVKDGFKKKLEIRGVGYRGQVQGDVLELNLGFSHPIKYNIPKEIEIKFDEKSQNFFTVFGINKELVGSVAAHIRSYRKPEPYKGKGIRYVDEYVARKAGKSAAAK